MRFTLAYLGTSFGVLLGGASSAYAQNPDYSDIGFKALTSWRCAVLALEGGAETVDAERLFDLGYPKMARVVEALRDGSVPQDQFASFPLFISGNLAMGPNVDFDLGVLWAVISEEVEEEISEKLPEFTIENFMIANETRKLAFVEEFQRSSCRFID